MESEKRFPAGFTMLPHFEREEMIGRKPLVADAVII